MFHWVLTSPVTHPHFGRAQKTPGQGLWPELCLQHSFKQPSHRRQGSLRGSLWVCTRQAQTHLEDWHFSGMRNVIIIEYTYWLHLAPTNLTFWFDFISGIQMNFFHDQDKVLTMCCCWKHWSGYRLEPRPHIRARAVIQLEPNLEAFQLFSGKRARGQKSSAQQENSATENIQAKWMNRDHISTTSNNDDALQDLKIPETCASAVHWITCP